MPFEDALSVIIYFHLPLNFPTGSFKPAIETAYSGEQTPDPDSRPFRRPIGRSIPLVSMC